MNRATEQSAINYGRALMAQVSTEECGATQPAEAWQAWTKHLFAGEDMIHAQVLSVWSQVTTPQTSPTSPAYVPLKPLSMAYQVTDGRRIWEMNPTRTESDYRAGVQELAKEFVAHGGASEQNFDRFFTLMQKYANALPCTYGENGVSLFRQWCMVAAVMALSTDGTPTGLPQSLGLIGLDLPGIQATVYTIASRGAGKGVRGRSAFVQLLVNALVDRLVHELNLCRANVLVNAGGNALLLCRWTDTLKTELADFGHHINELLFAGLSGSPFSGFAGDLSLAAACQQAPWDILIYPVRSRLDEDIPVSEWQYYEKLLKLKLAAAKQQPFVDLLNTSEKLERFFTPDPIASNRHCAVCHQPESSISSLFDPLNEDAQIDAASQPVICPMCRSFANLADDLAKKAWCLTSRTVDRTPADAAVWQLALHAISEGIFYSFENEPLSQGYNRALSLENFPSPNVQGFWPMAHTTPIQNHAIRDNQSLAEESPGTFKRLGILRADVDDLGSMLVHGLGDRRSAALTATMSEALSLFFGGWLDQICSEAIYQDKVYVLYAGGDDLLIVGTWDVMPLLAAHIAQDFERFTGNNPSIHLSAGIEFVGGKEPLYAAIERADVALKEAKRHQHAGRRVKRAIAIFGLTFSWEEFEEVSNWQNSLRQMIKGGVSYALLTTLQQLYLQHEDDKQPLEKSRSGYATRGKVGLYAPTQNEIVLGPWLWQMIYRMSRLRNQGDQSNKEFEELQTKLLTQDGIRQLAVSARWAQLLSREKV